MTFFRQKGESIDNMVGPEELEKAMFLRLGESAAWERHVERHKDAQLVKLDTEGEVAVMHRKGLDQKDPGEAQVFNYNAQTHKFTASCNCGQRFELDIKNDHVESVDSGLRLKELPQYGKNSEYDKKQDSTPVYSRSSTQQAQGYDSKGMAYKS